MYRLIQDEDSHWYICKSEDYDKLCEFFEQLDKYWNGEDYDMDEPTNDLEYIRINNYRDISFDVFEVA